MKFTRLHPFLLAALLSAPTTSLIAQEEDLGLDLAELFNVTIEVTSRSNSESIWEAAGIVSYISRDEILNAGCRDMIDVLQLVPGFSFGMDVQGITGLASRGQWGHEGKILLLIDGVKMNDRVYSTLQWGQHYPIDNIEKVEIIRGPGSALYGGFAELSVINLVTTAGSYTEELDIAATHGRLDSDYGHTRASISGAKKISDAMSAGGWFRYGNKVQSTVTYTDLYEEESFELTENSVGSYNGGLYGKLNDFELKFLFDLYKMQQQDEFDVALAEPVHNDFNMLNTHLNYNWKIGDKVTFTPMLTHLWQNNWDSPYNETADNYPYHAFLNSIELELLSSIDVTEKINIMAGVKGQYERLDLKAEEEYGLEAYGEEYFEFYNGTSTLDMTTANLYAQAKFNLPVFNLTAGAHVEYNTLYGLSAVPRLAMTKAFDKGYLKLLGSGAYRSPSFEHINGNYYAISEGMAIDSVKPEQTWVAEFEGGFKITPQMMLTGNIFYTNILDPIVYFYHYDEDTEFEVEGYRNYDKVSTAGAEVDYNLKFPVVDFHLNYSLYQAVENEVASYDVEDDEAFLLGLPTHKLNALTTLKLVDQRLKITPSLNLIGSRYGYTSVTWLDEEDYELNLEKVGITPLINANISYSFEKLKGLSLSLSAHNILDEKYQLLQPYDSEHAPMPTAGRELTFRVNYRL